MLTFLIVLEAIIAAAMIAVILMQKSEGGGLGVGGSPAGLLSARGAADFMTRTTAILATAFVGLSIAIAAFAATHNSSRTLDTSLSEAAKKAVPATSAVPLDGNAAAAGSAGPVTNPLAAGDDPLAAAAEAAAAQKAVPADAAKGGVPLEQ